MKTVLLPTHRASIVVVLVVPFCPTGHGRFSMSSTMPSKPWVTTHLVEYST
jgi:hypothetical protein